MTKLPIEIKGEVGGLVKDVAEVKNLDKIMNSHRDYQRRLKEGLVIFTPKTTPVAEAKAWIKEQFPDSDIQLNAHAGLETNWEIKWRWLPENHVQAMAIKLRWG